MHKKLSADTLIKTLVIILLLGWTLIPLWYLITVSLTAEGCPSFTFLPEEVSLAHYKEIMFGSILRRVWKPLAYSAIISGTTTVLAIILALPCAYALSRWRTTKGRMIYLSFFIGRMVPYIALLLPLYLIFNKVNLVDRFPTLILANLGPNVCVAVWLLQGFYQMVPIEIEESAWIDGATRWTGFIKVVTPMVTSGIFITALLVFVYVYTEFLLAVALVGSNVTVYSVYVQAAFKTEYIVFTKLTSAAVIIGLLPMLGLYLVIQKYLRRFAFYGLK